MNDHKMFHGATLNTFRKAFMLRKHETEVEKLLWERLSKNQIFGLRFKRQHPIAYYVADFYCHKAKLVIELDGGYHNYKKQKLYDLNRTMLMNDFGLKVLRFSDKEVLENRDGVVKVIESHLSAFARP
jgi:very-short-patch-repair endonuclease